MGRLSTSFPTMTRLDYYYLCQENHAIPLIWACACLWSSVRLCICPQTASYVGRPVMAHNHGLIVVAVTRTSSKRLPLPVWCCHRLPAESSLAPLNWPPAGEAIYRNLYCANCSQKYQYTLLSTLPHTLSENMLIDENIAWKLKKIWILTQLVQCCLGFGLIYIYRKQ